jgi:hypothetical protein
MKESLMLINKTNPNSSNPTNTQETPEIPPEDSHKNNDTSSSVNLQPIINNSFMNINNIPQFTPVPIINQINYNNMQYIKANQVNIMNTVRPQVPVFPVTVYPSQLQPNHLQQPILGNPQIMPGVAPCYLNNFINPNMIIPAPTNVNPIMLNNQGRFGTFSPMPPPVFFPQQVIVTNPFPPKPFIINGTVNLHHSVPQNTPIQTNINNHLSVTEKPKIPITQAKIEIVDDEKKKVKSQEKRQKLDEVKSQTMKETITMIKLPKIENLPPLPKEEEVQNIRTKNDNFIINKSVGENVSKHDQLNNLSKSKTIDLVLNKAKESNSSIIDVKKIPVGNNSITSSSSSSDSSESDDESESSSDSSSDSKVTKKKRWRTKSKSGSKSNSDSYKGKRENKIGKYDRRRNRRETKKRSRNK